MFCGAGGTSTGLLEACQAMGIELNLIAINHWQVAIDTHTANHAYAKHLCGSVDSINPRELVPSGRLHLMVASPECTHHSNARGGRPMNDQSRASAWHVLRWAEALYIENIIVENVKEFRSWGPLGANGRPIKKLRGELYLAFLNGLRALGYKVEDNVLNAANYGDPTTRERLFVIARRGARSIVWPQPSHGKNEKSKTGQRDMFGSVKPWRTAREIIDWEIEGKSIFTRKRPLAPKTIGRIAAGLRKFCGEYAEPFLVMLYGTNDVRSLDQPLPTVTATGNHIGLCEPFIIPQFSGQSPKSVDQPLGTLTTTSRGVALVEPFIIGAGGPERGGKPRSIDEPMNTVLTKNSSALIEPFIMHLNRPQDNARSVDDPMQTVTAQSADFGLVEPFILNLDHRGGNGQQVRPVNEPLNTVTTKARACLVEPFMVPFFGEREGQEPRCHSVDEPMPVVTGHGAGALIEPFMVEVNHGDSKREKNASARRATSVDEPMPTVTTKRGRALVQPFLVKYNGTAKSQSVDEPLGTVSTKDRFGLVETERGTYQLDIRFRMLEPHELAAAQGLAGYLFTGKKTEIVKQIGNAVPKNLARALCSQVLQ